MKGLSNYLIIESLRVFLRALINIGFVFGDGLMVASCIVATKEVKLQPIKNPKLQTKGV